MDFQLYLFGMKTTSSLVQTNFTSGCEDSCLKLCVHLFHCGFHDLSHNYFDIIYIYICVLFYLQHFQFNICVDFIHFRA